MCKICQFYIFYQWLTVYSRYKSNPEFLAKNVVVDLYARLICVPQFKPYYIQVLRGSLMFIKCFKYSLVHTKF